MIFKTVVTTLIVLMCLVIGFAIRNMKKTDKTLAGLFIVVYIAAVAAIWL